jgi:uncharacterized protein YoxC
MSFVEVLNIISVIIQIILFITLIILVVILTGYIKKLMIKVEVLSDDFNKYKVHLNPLIENISKLVGKLHNISDKVDTNLETVKRTVQRIKDTTESIIEFEQKIQTKLETPVFDTIDSYNAIVKGVRAFFEKIKSRGHKSAKTTDEPDFDSEAISPQSTENSESSIFDEEIQEEFNDINKELNEVRKKLEEMKKV